MRVTAILPHTAVAMAGTHIRIPAFALLLIKVCIALCVLALLAKLLLYAARLARRKTSFYYVPFSHDLKNVLVTDCTHPHARTLTHHKGQRNPARLRPSDTSTGLVLNALKASPWSAGQAYEWCQLAQVSTNHFDVDSFLSVWCYINRGLALQHEAILRHMARIGDFREAFLSPYLVAVHGPEDGIYNIRDAFTALKLVCWINCLERSRFSAPYEGKDCEAKFAFFLPRFAAVLKDPEAEWQQWQDEYREVVSGFDVLTGEPPSVERYGSVGLVVLRVPEPTLHYYSLFSHTVGYDTVLTVYDNQRYELECKYTQFVSCYSRPVWPRVDLGPLARLLNMLEGEALGPQLRWNSARFTDTGPVLRIEDTAAPLSKAQLYGQPYARRLHCSTLPPATMVAVVMSFLEYGMQGLKPKKGGWTWDELQSLNSGIAWREWEDTVRRQWDRGELHPEAYVAAAAAANNNNNNNSGATGRQQGSSFSGGGAAAAAGSPPRVGVAMTPGGGGGGFFLEPSLSERSSVMSQEDLRALAGAVPPRLASGRWQLLYSSARDGISLRTLYRNAAGRAPTLLLVREVGACGHVFGAFAAEAWKPGPRFYGTGETFVFTLQPRRVKFPWQRPRHGTGVSGGGAAVASASAASVGGGGGGGLDYFQFSTPEGLGVGGCGSFALWLDNELLQGASYACDTFGSPQLSAREEFHVSVVELWQL
ncbi:hypothetical protein VOLCADRAFT_107660 [Volvox carteri f. nagariensis]|uniref:Oxidation resistance protein 1 n=1 Tax=Volvox carteri f. nagariensis TaxID=3068 RepID=D8UFG3_VOLCA|nr:uncharacterized protein VOLCADRAFT_107660 [Volvox carteri f. nagariensis]EFJ41453.1 hypothetical protein VOLCADRAFT_107660 [Volvox carteri f. nagariensis]|eukprot:XP_002957398.1 hypothetical protein VOLCADRAFT_107660 [Volvox carteri f. nagariensis]